MSLLVSHSSLALVMSHHHQHRIDDADDAHTRALDATSTDPWGPSHALLDQLCQFTHNTRYCADVLHVLYDALNATGPQWRRVLKALTTLAHCLRHPSPEITLFTTAHRTLIRNLTQFQYIDPYRLDRGAAVREEAHVVVTLMMRQHHRDDAEMPSGRSSITSVTATPTQTHAAPPRQTPASPGPLFPISLSHIYPTSNPSHHPPHRHLHTRAPRKRDLVQESIHDSATLDALLSHLESVPAPTSAFGNDNIWLEIYKLLFLLNSTLPTASDDTIQYWVENRALLGRVVKEAGRAEKEREKGGPGGSDAHGQSVAWEVMRFAGELRGVLEGGGGAGEVRRRAGLF